MVAAVSVNTHQQSILLKRSSDNWGQPGTTKIPSAFLFLGILSIYLLLRAIAWNNTVLFEDTDSLFYIKSIRAYLSFSAQQINSLNPDSTPFYPFFSALCTLPGFSVETGARLCSLIFSVILFAAIFGIAKQATNQLGTALCLLILSFNAHLISLSFSVLTEASYIATVYLGFWFFLSQYEKPKLWKGGLLGILFALSFLNRIEGLIYFAFVPFLQGLHFTFRKNKLYGGKRFIGWTLAFVTCFSFFAVPQIWHVSHKMGTLAINGRQAWRLIDHNLTGKSHEEKIFGLDFSPYELNITYARKNYSKLHKQMTLPKTRYTDHFKRFYRNLNQVYRIHSIKLFGPLGVVLFVFGVLGHYRTRRRLETLFFLLFIGMNLVAPLSHSDYVLVRHILVIVPIIALFEAIGILYLSRKFVEPHQNPLLSRRVLPFIIFIVLIAASAHPLVRTFRPPHFNREYSPVELKEPTRIVQKIVREESIQQLVIAAQRGYLAYYSGAIQTFLPFSDYEAFVKYCTFKKVDFLYLKHGRVEPYPFFKKFLQDRPPSDFTLLYRGFDATGKGIELYRFKNKET